MIGEEANGPRKLRKLRKLRVRLDLLRWNGARKLRVRLNLVRGNGGFKSKARQLVLAALSLIDRGAA